MLLFGGGGGAKTGAKIDRSMELDRGLICFEFNYEERRSGRALTVCGCECSELKVVTLERESQRYAHASLTTQRSCPTACG